MGRSEPAPGTPPRKRRGGNARVHSSSPSSLPSDMARSRDEGPVPLASSSSRRPGGACGGLKGPPAAARAGGRGAAPFGGRGTAWTRDPRSCGRRACAARGLLTAPRLTSVLARCGDVYGAGRPRGLDIAWLGPWVRGPGCDAVHVVGSRDEGLRSRAFGNAPCILQALRAGSSPEEGVSVTRRYPLNSGTRRDGGGRVQGLITVNLKNF